MAQKLARITKPYVLICEGQHDSQFFEYLAQVHNLPQFEICSANYVLGISHGGNTKFAEALDALVSLPGFLQVEKILVVADNDLDPTAAFNYVVAQINATAEIVDPFPHRFIAPLIARQKAGVAPAVVILMLPETDVDGSLDTMCLTAAANHAPAISGCVDTLAQCAHSDAWPLTTLAKMKLRSIFSVSWKDDPNISPAYIWSNNTNLVPLNDYVFSDVVSFLRGFPAL